MVGKRPHYAAGGLAVWLCFIMLAAGLAAPATAGPDEGRAAYKRSDYRAAAQAFIASARGGDAGAMVNLGGLYAEGLGVRRDFRAAFRWYAAAAALGDAGAMYNLGWLFSTGSGVVADYGEAARWYRKAAGLGNVGAMHGLGLLYGRGDGVPRDPAEARRWFARAAEALAEAAANGGGAGSPAVEACLPERLHPMSQLFLDRWFTGAMPTMQFLRWFHMPNSSYLLVARCLLSVVART